MKPLPGEHEGMWAVLPFTVLPLGVRAGWAARRVRGGLSDAR